MKNLCTITGSSGFIGQNLNLFLKDRNKHYTNLCREDLYKIQPELLNNSKVVIHLAGLAHDVLKVACPGDYYEVNYELTRNLYDAFLKSDASSFIFISSVKASADKTDKILDEESHPAPVTDYGKSKLMAERYLLSRCPPSGKSCYILRPCMTHGVGNKGNLNLLFKLIEKGVPYPLASFENKRSFLSIQNLCFVIYELLTRDDIPSGVYNVADDEPLSTNEIVTILSDSLNKPSKLWKVSPNVMKAFAKIGDVLRLPLTTERLEKLTENYVVSNAKLKNVLNKPFPLTSLEGLKYTAETFQQNPSNFKSYLSKRLVAINE